MPKSFIYSVRNYRNRKPVDTAEDPIFGPIFPSGILTRSGKLTDRHGNEVPLHVAEHYHYVYNQQQHQQRTMVKHRAGNVTAQGTGVSAQKERERKRKAKAKPKSFHHLSLVTRFQLGLRMSRLRSRQRPTYADVSNARVKVVQQYATEQNNAQTSEMMNGNLRKKHEKSSDMMADEYASSSTPIGNPALTSLPLNIVKSEVDKALAPTEKLTNSSPVGIIKLCQREKAYPGYIEEQIKRETPLQSNDTLLKGTPYQDTNEKPDVSDMKKMCSGQSTSDINDGLHRVDIISNNAPRCDVDKEMQRADNCLTESTPDSEIAKPLHNKRQQSPDQIMTDEDKRQRIDVLAETSPTPGLASSHSQTQRPKIVITLSGSKSRFNDREYVSINEKRNYCVDETASASKSSMASVSQSVTDLSAASTNALNANSTSALFLRPCQVIYTQPTTVNSDPSTDRQTLTGGQLLQVPKETTMRCMHSLSNAGPNTGIGRSAESFSNFPYINKVTTINRSDPGVQKSNIVLVEKSNMYDESEQTRLQNEIAYFPINSNQSTSDGQQKDQYSAFASLPQGIELHNAQTKDMAERDQQSHVAVSKNTLRQNATINAYTFKSPEQSTEHNNNKENRANENDLKQTKVVAPYDTSLWTSRCENIDDDRKNTQGIVMSGMQNICSESAPGDWYRISRRTDSIAGVRFHDRANLPKDTDIGMSCVNTASEFNNHGLSKANCLTNKSSTLSEEFQRINAFYSNEPRDYITICTPGVRQQNISQLNATFEDKRSSPTDPSPINYDNNATEHADEHRTQPPIWHQTTVDQSLLMPATTVDSSMYFKAETLTTTSERNPLFNQKIARKSHDDRNMDAENENGTNGKRILFVPPSNVFSVTTGGTQYPSGNEFNKLTDSDIASVTWSNAQWSFPLQTHHFINQTPLPKSQTNFPVPSSNFSAKNDCSQQDINTVNTLKDTSNCVVNLPFDYKFPVRKDDMAGNQELTTLSLLTNCENFNHPHSRSQQSSPQKFDALGHFRTTDAQNSVIQNKTLSCNTMATQSAGSSSNKMTEPSVDNFIGWVHVRLSNSNENVQKPIMFVPTQGVNSNTLTDSQAAIVANQKSIGVSYSNFLPATPNNAGILQGMDKLPTGSNVNAPGSNPSAGHGHVPSTLIIRSVESSAGNSNNALLSSFVPVKLSWLPVVNNQDTNNNLNMSGAGFSNFQTKQNSGQGTFAIQTSHAQENFSSDQIREKSFTSTVNIQGINFATPAADLLSSVAKVPAQASIYKSNNRNQGVIYKPESQVPNLNGQTGFSGLAEFRNIDTPRNINMPHIPQTKNEETQDVSFTNQLPYFNFGQSISCDQPDKGDKLFMAHSGYQFEGFESRKTKSNENDCIYYKSTNDSKQPNWFGDCNLRKQGNENTASARTVVETPNERNLPLFLQKDQTGGDTSGRIAIGVLGPLATSRAGEYKHAMNLNSNNSFHPVTNLSSTTKILPIHCPTLFTSETLSFGTDKKTNEPSVIDTGVKTNKSASAVSDRPTQIYIANPFVNEPIYPSALQGITSSDRDIQNAGMQKYVKDFDTGVGGDKKISPSFIQNNAVGNIQQQCFVQGGTTIGKQHVEQSKAPSWQNSSFLALPPNSISLSLQQRTVPILKQHTQTGNTTLESVSSRNDVSKKERFNFKLDRKPQSISAVAIPAVMKPFKNSIGIISSSSSSGGGCGSGSNDNNNNIGASSSNNNSNTNNNVCPICHRQFTRPWLLKGHMRTHTGERPFSCSFPSCEKAFADKSNLRSHMHTHTAVTKNFECPRCGRAFSQKRYLHKHTTEVCKYGNK